MLSKTRIDKRCSSCKQVKSRDNFWKQKNSKDGLQNYCKPCRYSVQRAWYKANPEKYSEYRHKHYIKREEHWKEYSQGKGRFKVALGLARRRGYEFELTEAQWQELVFKPCHYCGYELSKMGLGLDRVDNKLHYTVENVVPCCGTCNRVKADEFSYGEMKILAEAIRVIKSRRIEAAVKKLTRTEVM